MTIFQKMLVAPLLGLLLYSTFLFYILGEHRQSSATMEAIRDSYLPVRETAGENVILFDNIGRAFKDAALAGEVEWVRNTSDEKERIEKNLSRLASYDEVVSPEALRQLRESFRDYYKNAFALSMAMIEEGAESEKLNTLIEDALNLQRTTTRQFNDLKASLQQSLSDRIIDTNKRLDRLLLVGLIVGALDTVLVVGVTFALSLSTRKSLSEVNNALQNLAQDKSDFSARLVCDSADELGELVKWFNLLSDKLEVDYKRIEFLSITDKLTQLNNRLRVDELFGAEVGKASRYDNALSMILIDLDHFKMVNDTYGHQVGDTVLRTLAHILRDSLRAVDHIGRWGGEEFVVLCPNTDLEQASQLAEKLRQEVEKHHFADVGCKTCSFGVASFRPGDSEASITKRADDCLYLAKERGRNRVIAETKISGTS